MLSGHGKARRTVTQNDGKRTLLQKMSFWQSFSTTCKAVLSQNDGECTLQQKSRLGSGFQVTQNDTLAITVSLNLGQKRRFGAKCVFHHFVLKLG